MLACQDEACWHDFCVNLSIKVQVELNLAFMRCLRRVCFGKVRTTVCLATVYSKCISTIKLLFLFFISQWASILSRVALEQKRMLPVILDLLKTNSDDELRSLTGFLRNLSRHAKDKNDMGEASFSSHKTGVNRTSVALEKLIAQFLSF